MQFCFMITYDVVTSESDRDAQIPNGFTTIFGKYRTREQRLCFFKILQFPLVLLTEIACQFRCLLVFYVFKLIMVFKTPTKNTTNRRTQSNAQ